MSFDYFLAALGITSNEWWSKVTRNQKNSTVYYISELSGDQSSEQPKMCVPLAKTCYILNQFALGS